MNIPAQLSSMPKVRRTYKNHHLDSTHWDRFDPRAGDIVLSTSIKSGTTWMQYILLQLVFHATKTKPNTVEVSPWLDERTIDLDAVLATLERQRHRRIIKSHLPFDGLPYHENVHYVVVARDARDVFMSLWNHYRHLTPHAYRELNAGSSANSRLRFPECTSDIKSFWRRWIGEGWFDWESEGYPFWGNLRHTQTWWEFRHLPNLLLVHYNDLLTDPAGEISRVARHIGLSLDQSVIDRIVDATSFACMKAKANTFLEGEGASFEGGGDTFIHKGTNGRWRDVLDENDLDAYRRAATRELSPDCINWLERGRLGKQSESSEAEVGSASTIPGRCRQQVVARPTADATTESVKSSPTSSQVSCTRIRATRCKRTIFRGGLTTEAFTDLKIIYPPSVVDALVSLYSEYNRTFKTLVERNREWDSDYAHCFDSALGSINWIVQIDMAGLPADELAQLAVLPSSEVAEVLRGRIFEIENSWAAYRTHADALGADRGSRYARMSDRMLEGVRERFGRPIALFAETHEKYRSLIESECGRPGGDPPTGPEVRRLCGFDDILGPDEFARHIAANAGQCEYLLYVRSSDPVEALRETDADVEVSHPLLGDPAVRCLIRKNALTFNIDDPAWKGADPRRINDTKMYMPSMGMGHVVETESDLERISDELGGCRLRVKPAQGSYGCYGHLSGTFSDKRFRYAVRSGLRRWHRFVVQPEKSPPEVINEIDGTRYAFMDRIFCGIVDGRPAFFGGHRLHLEQNCPEAKRRRLHIVRDTVFAEIATEAEHGQ